MLTMWSTCYAILFRSMLVDVIVQHECCDSWSVLYLSHPSPPILWLDGWLKSSTFFNSRRLVKNAARLSTKKTLSTSLRSRRLKVPFKNNLDTWLILIVVFVNVVLHIPTQCTFLKWICFSMFGVFSALQSRDSIEVCATLQPGGRAAGRRDVRA